MSFKDKTNGLISNLKAEAYSAPEVERYLGKGKEEGTWLVACSGGADSIFLIFWLLARYEKKRDDIVLVHVDHGQRADSVKDAEFVRERGLELGLDVIIEQAEVDAGATEADLRDARNGLFAEVAEAFGADLIFLGHHLNDLAETLIMRMGTGNGLSGMSGLRWIQPMNDGLTRLRPLLALKSEKIRSLLSEFGIEWREDSSNSEPYYTRNRLRMDVVPALEAALPQDLLSGIARTHALLNESEIALEEWVDREFKDRLKERDRLHFLDADGLEGLPKAIIRGLLWRLWEASQIGENAKMSGAVVDRIVDKVSEGRFHVEQISNRLFCERKCFEKEGGDFILFEFREEKLDDTEYDVHWAWRSGPLFLPNGAILRAKIVHGDELMELARKSDVKSEAMVAISEETLLISTWKNGDRYKPLGAPGRRKLQDLFTDRKICIEQRRKIPVIKTLDEEILYIPHLGIADHQKIKANIKSALRLTYDHL